MSMFDETFVLNDALGKPHTYEVRLHDGDVGYKLSVELTTLGLPLLTMLTESANAAALTELLKSVDVPGLTDRVLAHTHRDGQPLAQPVVFKAAYRANYEEAYAATAKVIALNRFFPQLDTFLKGANVPTT